LKPSTQSSAPAPDLLLQPSAVSYERARRNVAHFVRHCLIVEKETGALIPFDLWAEQETALAAILRDPFVVWPKGRQIGATWIVLAAMAHAGSFVGHRLFPIARQNEDYAKDAIRRLLYLLGYDPESDPPNMRVLPESPMPTAWRPAIASKTLKSITFANGSHFQALTATQSIARGEAAYWALADEFAFWPWPKKQLAALEHGASRVTVVSTGEMEEDDFHHLYQTAVTGRGKWRAHFTSAAADPRRDPEWFRINVDEAPDPDLARRELARSVEDVFRPLEGSYFKRFSRERNVREFDLVGNWPTSKGLDFGLVHPFCVWVQTSPAGQPFVFAEYGPEDLPTPEFAAGILQTETALLASEGVKLVLPAETIYCDPAGKSRNSQTSRSEFDVMRVAGFRPLSMTSSVRDGCDLMKNSIADPDIPLVVHPRCEKLIRALSQMPPDPHDPNVYLQKHPVLSHPLDALRYWFVNNRAAGRRSTSPVAGGTRVTAGLAGRRF
jgi:hypothetical protein